MVVDYLGIFKCRWVILTLLDLIRVAVRWRGVSRNRQAQQTGVDQAYLRRFLKGDGHTTTTLDVLAEVLHLAVEAKGPRAPLLQRHGR